MTKAELITKLASWSDDATVCIVTPVTNGWVCNDIAEVYDNTPSCPPDCNEVYLKPTRGRIDSTNH